jgi:hypothetical protein
MKLNTLKVFGITFGINLLGDFILLLIFGVKIFSKQSLIILLLVSLALTFAFKQLNLIKGD